MKQLFLCLLALVVLGSPTDCQTPTINWLNVLDFGAKGDGESDDTPGIFKAIEAAGKNGNGFVVYFPPGHQFLIASAQTLPSTPATTNHWVTLFLDSPLTLGGTLTVPFGYKIHGNSSGQVTAFSMDSLGLIWNKNSPNPLIYINTAAVRLENLQFAELPIGSDGIVIRDSANVTLDNVWIHASGTGMPLRIKGGFRFHVKDGGYAAVGTGPSIEITDNDNCTFSGMVQVTGTFLEGHGIAVRSKCGGINSLSFDHILYEDPKDAFLTIDSTASSSIFGIAIDNVNVADPVVSPTPGIVDAHCRGCSGIVGVTLRNSPFFGPYITTGDTIRDLEVWDPWGSKPMQPNYYVLHTPNQIINTMPTYPASGAADFSISPDGKLFNIASNGSSVTFSFTVSATNGFNQTIQFTCSGAPTGAACSVAPAAINLNGPAAGSILLTVTTTARTAHFLIPFEVKKYWPEISVFVSLCLFWLFVLMTGRVRGLWNRRALAVTAMACVAVFAVACARASATPPPQSTPVMPTPSGDYPITVTGITSGTVQSTHSFQVIMGVE